MTHRVTSYQAQVVLDTPFDTLSEGAQKTFALCEPSKTVETVATLADVKA